MNEKYVSPREENEAWRYSTPDHFFWMGYIFGIITGASVVGLLWFFIS